MRSPGRVSTVGSGRHLRAVLLPVLLSVLLTVLLLGSLAGCSLTPALLTDKQIATEDSPSPTPSRPSPEKVFAGDAEALAAATLAFTAYQAASDAVTARGGIDPEQVQPLASLQYWPTLLAAFRAFERTGQRLSGDTRFDSAQLMQYDDTVAGAEVRLVVCADLSQTRLITAAGEDVTPPLRPGRLAYQIDFISSEDDARVLLLDGERPRDGLYEC